MDTKKNWSNAKPKNKIVTSENKSYRCNYCSYLFEQKVKLYDQVVCPKCGNGLKS